MSNLLERFEAKYIPEPNSGCFLWTASLDGMGYGKIWVGHRLECAHRVSWEMHRGPIPDGLRVLHRCDNPCCVNPGHLFLGTQGDNMQDMAAKGRHLPGQANASSKLTEAQVIAIRADRRLQAEIAADYGVCVPNISMIQNRRTWAHL